MYPKALIDGELSSSIIFKSCKWNLVYYLPDIVHCTHTHTNTVVLFGIVQCQPVKFKLNDYNEMWIESKMLKVEELNLDLLTVSS